MTSHPPSPLDVQPNPLHRSFKSLLANPAAPSSHTRTMVQPLPLSPAPSRPRTNSISASPATSPSRPSPRFHVTNPTERPESPTITKPLVARSSEPNRPLPSSPNRQDIKTTSPPRIHINTSCLNSESPHSPPSVSTAPPPSSSSSFTHPKHMSKPSLPFASSHVPSPLPLSDAALTSGRTTPVSPSTIPRHSIRPLPPPPPLPKAQGASVSGPRPRSSSRGPTPRSRTNSATGRGEASSRPQLTFDPTSSSYVIKTASEVNGHISSPATATGVGLDKSPRPHVHSRSRSAQFKNFSSMVLPDRDPPSSVAQRASTGTRWKGKQAVRSAPSSDTEDCCSPSPQTPSKSRRSRRLVLHNPTEPSPKPSYRSAPNSDEEDSYLSSPASLLSTSTALTSPLLLPPTGSIKDILPQLVAQPQPTVPSRTFEPFSLVRQTPPPGGVSRIISPPPLPPLSEDVGYAEQGYVDDVRVYVDDGYDGPGGLGAFSTSVDPDVDVDIGNIVFSTRPPSGEFMGPSVMDLDMEGRGRHVSRSDSGHGHGHGAAPSTRWKSADAEHASVGNGAGNRTGKGQVGGSRGTRSSSHGQAVIMSSLTATMRTVPEVELGPSPINIDLEPEMVFSKNPSSPVPVDEDVPGVLDFAERTKVKGRWRSPGSAAPRSRNGTAMKEIQRFPTMSGQFAPVRSKVFYEDW
ncbi:hypothetical protein GYMLUDRAFT_48130 [Collybiopsis luxurians FD-317 M1]|uniref:Uncharacterized protein n=1 Tax=Collybiopsis luxurians FD-317 M1 TaxID=944289 RepID=A0A0D0CJH4_9AGAR|nr:hypothetical protein GYMLUDRAFT_48130 [Collybiopsis luxurians FD-317 M1]